jgi:hypothetical protein
MDCSLLDCLTACYAPCERDMADFRPGNERFEG